MGIVDRGSVGVEVVLELLAVMPVGVILVLVRGVEVAAAWIAPLLPRQC
jgi:hypothetical protein